MEMSNVWEITLYIWALLMPSQVIEFLSFCTNVQYLLTGLGLPIVISLCCVQFLAKREWFIDDHVMPES